MRTLRSVLVAAVACAAVIWASSLIPLKPSQIRLKWTVDRWFRDWSKEPMRWQLTAEVRAASNWYVACPATAGNDALGQVTAADSTTLWTIMGATTHPDDVINLVGTSITGTGRYTGGSCMIAPPAGLDGTAGHPITIQTVDSPTLNHVVIDGGGVQTAVVSLSGHSNWTLNGVSACCLGNSSNGPFTINNGASNILIQNAGCWDGTGDNNSQCFQFANSLATYPQARLGQIVVDTYYVFGKNRKGSSSYANDGVNPSTIMRRGIEDWNYSLQQGPKYTDSSTYHSKGAVRVDITGFFSADAMPSAYNLQCSGADCILATSTTSNTIAGSGTKTFTVSTCSNMTSGTNKNIRAQQHTNHANFMTGATTCTGTGPYTLTMTVSSSGGSGTISNWDLDQYYFNNQPDQPSGIFGGDGNDSTHDGNSDAKTRWYGDIAIIRNSDTFAAQCWFVSQFTDVVVQDSVCALDSNWTSKTGFTLATCNSASLWPSGCVSPQNQFATNISLVGNGFTPSSSQNNIQGTWTQTNVVRLPKASYVYGGTGTNKDNICGLHNDDGTLKSPFQSRWPHPLQAAMTTARAAYGYSALDEKGAVAAALGSIPAPCDASLVTPSPTPTAGGPTSTPTPTLTPSPTPTPTPAASPTAVPVPTVVRVIKVPPMPYVRLKTPTPTGN